MSERPMEIDDSTQERILRAIFQAATESSEIPGDLNIARLKATIKRCKHEEYRREVAQELSTIVWHCTEEGQRIETKQILEIITAELK